MFNKDKRSFFERITGSISVNDEDEVKIKTSEQSFSPKIKGNSDWLNADEPIEEIEEVGELSVDVYQTDDNVVIQAMIAGVRPEDLDVSITREMVTLEGRRQKTTEAEKDGYFMRELYWGSFSRTITLPEEIDVDDAEAVEKHGLLILKLPKLDKKRQSKLKVKTI